MVPADSRRIPRDPRYSGLRWGWRSFVYRTITVCGGTFQTLPLETLLPDRVPTTPDMPKHARFGLFPVRSPLLGESLLFSLPAGTKMFQFPAFASPSNIMVITTKVVGLSHSEIVGSRDICASPTLFAAYRVLHRLLEPRHPPCALYYFLYLATTVPITGRGHVPAASSARGLYSFSFLSLAIRLIYFNSVISMSWIFTKITDWLRLSSSPEWRITDSNR